MEKLKKEKEEGEAKIEELRKEVAAKNDDVQAKSKMIAKVYWMCVFVFVFINSTTVL